MVSLRAIHLYTSGRKYLPVVEAKLARVFQLSVPALRHLLGLHPLPAHADRRTMVRVQLSLANGEQWMARIACARNPRATEPPAPPRPTSVQQQPPARTEAEFIARFGGPKGGRS